MTTFEGGKIDRDSFELHQLRECLRIARTHGPVLYSQGGAVYRIEQVAECFIVGPGPRQG